MSASIDLLDPAGYERGVPHDRFRRLRETRGPVFAAEDPTHGGFWAVLGHPEIVAISKNPGVFSSARRGTQLADPTPEQVALVRTMMLNLDPPEHGRFRALVHAGFTPTRTQRLEPRVRALARQVLDRALERDEFDFVREIAAELPLLVLAELLGVPEADRGLLFDWSNRMVGFDDPEFSTSPDDALVAATEMYMYAHTLADARRAEPRDDLISVLVHAEVDGRRLREEEFNGLFVQIAVAGNETTRSLIAGGMYELLTRPQVLDVLREQPIRIEGAVEEMLRWVSPVLHFRRTASRDVTLAGADIRTDDKIVLFYCAANRDPRVFAEPERFEFVRHPNPHLAFGIGEHFCLGAALARLEARALFEELLARPVRLEPIGPPRRLRSNQINGIKEMRVAVRR